MVLLAGEGESSGWGKEQGLRGRLSRRVAETARGGKRASAIAFKTNLLKQ